MRPAPSPRKMRPSRDVWWGKSQGLKRGIVALNTQLSQVFGKPSAFIRFHIEKPRPYDMVVSIVNIDMVGIVVGSVLYSTTLSKSVPSEISLPDRNASPQSQFVGGAAPDKLNGNPALMTAVNDLVRATYSPLSGVKVKAPSMFQISPAPSGSNLLVKTLPTTKWFGYVSSFNIKSFLGMADLLEATL